MEAAASGLQQDSDGDSDTSSSSATSSDDSLDEIAEDLRADTRYLTGLGPLLRNPIFDEQPDLGVRDSLVHTWSPAKSYADRIETRLPLADKSLIAHLGKTNYERYLRCLAIRDSHESSISQGLLDGAGSVITGSKFHDSGLGTSIAPTLSYAETTMSYSREGESVRIPPLPDAAKTGTPFDCVACGATLAITNNSTWK